MLKSTALAPPPVWPLQVDAFQTCLHEKGALNAGAAIADVGIAKVATTHRATADTAARARDCLVMLTIFVDLQMIAPAPSLALDA
jgi:hypothetical protein